MMQTKWLSYADIRQRQRNSPLRQAEIPVEHAISLPMPSLRLGAPTYISFASPARRQPNQPMQQSAPDRWWALDARSGHLVVYTLTAAMPIAPEAHWDTVTLPPVTRSVDELRQTLAQIETQMNDLAPVFFAGNAGEKSEREALAHSLQAILPDPLVPQYQVLAPDFFRWLDA